MYFPKPAYVCARKCIWDSQVVLVVKNPPANLTREGDGTPLQYSCLENPHGQRSLVGYSPWGCKESDTTE